MTVPVEQFYSVVNEQELNEMIAGRVAGTAFHWPSIFARHLSDGNTGILWRKAADPDSAAQPLALVIPSDQLRRLFGRFAQLRSDLSPLSAWCHILTPDRFYGLESNLLQPEMNGLEAAWSGAVIAEAVLLAEKPLASLRLPACFATHGFAIARANALWGKMTPSEIATRVDSANRLLKSENPTQRNAFRTSRVRLALEPLWQVLLSLSNDSALTDTALASISHAVKALQIARQNKQSDEWRSFSRHLAGTIPEAQDFAELEWQTPEQRLKLFDKLVDAIAKTNFERESFRRVALAALAGYLSTIAAGGKPSLKLAETHAYRWPEITAWAYALGGIGERVFWASGFDGLGRLVARELTRPLVLNEPPSCDLALDEAAVLIDSKLSDPLVHLRIKQARIATIAILPGVNISVLIAESSTQEPVKESGRTDRQIPQPQQNLGRDLAAAIADAIWPHLQPKVEEAVRSSHAARNKKKAGSQSQLSLKEQKG